MKPQKDAAPHETELKFALPEPDARVLAEALRRAAPLARRKSATLELQSVYFDTAQGTLHDHGIALRVRCVDDGGRIQWLQTLKTAGDAGAGLSRRGEWEVPVAGPAPELAALQATPWAALDADGSLFGRLEPRFSTRFARRLWVLRRGKGSVVEVAWDLGETVAGAKTAPIRELEIELKAGDTAALFEVAAELAQTVALLPAGVSKAQRGYALAAGELNRPRRAAPPELGKNQALALLAHRVLAEAFAQFADNLVALSAAEDPEVVHQARVGWRRFRSALRLLSPALRALPPPRLDALRPLREQLGRLRDTDVAATETLPAWTVAYAGSDAQRLGQWNALENALRDAGAAGRRQLRELLREPAVGQALLAVVQWLEQLRSEAAQAMPLPGGARSPRQWLRQRAERLHHKLQVALKQREDAESEHRARIVAKNARYGIEAMAALLPGKARGWAKEAAAVQEQIGSTRDLALAVSQLQGLDEGGSAAEFLRGVAAGQRAAWRRAR